MFNRFKSSSVLTPPATLSRLSPMTGSDARASSSSSSSTSGGKAQLRPVPSAWALRCSPWVSAALWAALAYSAVAWGLVWFTPHSPALAVHTLVTNEPGPTPLDPQALSVALAGPGPGAALQAAPTQDLSALSSARMRLSGLIYAKPSSTRSSSSASNAQAMALLSVDDRAPKAYRLGQAIEPGLYVVAIEPRTVKLGPTPSGEATLTLSLPPQPGVLLP